VTWGPKLRVTQNRQSTQNRNGIAFTCERSLKGYLNHNQRFRCLPNGGAPHCLNPALLSLESDQSWALGRSALQRDCCCSPFRPELRNHAWDLSLSTGGLSRSGRIFRALVSSEFCYLFVFSVGLKLSFDL